MAALSKLLTLTNEDDGKPFLVRILHTGEEQIVRHAASSVQEGMRRDH